MGINIPDLPAGTPLDGTELLEVVQNGVNKEVPASDFAGLVSYNRHVTDLGTITGAVSIDFSVGGIYTGTLTGNVTLSFTGAPTGTIVRDIELRLTQDATGGRTVTWPANGAWPGASPFVLTTAAGARDDIAIALDAAGHWTGYPVEDVG